MRPKQTDCHISLPTGILIQITDSCHSEWLTYRTYRSNTQNPTFISGISSFNTDHQLQTQQQQEQVSWKHHHCSSSRCSLPELSVEVRFGNTYICPADTASVFHGNDEHNFVCHQLASTLLLDWWQVCPVGFRGSEGKVSCTPTRHAMPSYLYSRSADKLHHMPADTKEPGHFCCKAETHPGLGTSVTDSQHLPCITSANSSRTSTRFAQLG